MAMSNISPTKNAVKLATIIRADVEKIWTYAGFSEENRPAGGNTVASNVNPSKKISITKPFRTKLRARALPKTSVTTSSTIKTIEMVKIPTDALIPQKLATLFPSNSELTKQVI